MSTPILDDAERAEITNAIRSMKDVEHRILASGRRVSHVSGRILTVPRTFDYSNVRANESPLSFTDVVLALIVDDRFFGIDCTPQHYLNKAWENSKILSRVNGELAGKRALNVGGGSCLINSYLAFQGMRVVSVDNCERYPELIDNENEIARSFDLDLLAIDHDFLTWESNERFEYVFSICVIEHLPNREMQAQFVRRMARYVESGGLLLLTFGFGPKGTTNPYLNEEDVAQEIYSNLVGFEIIDPFSFSGIWTISEGHTWGYLAARKL